MFKFDLLKNERVVTMYRQTELVLVRPVLLIFVLIYIPWFFLIKYELYFEYRFWLLGWTLLVLLFAVNNYILWLLNVYVVTSERLIIFEYKKLTRKTVLESPLQGILNVSFKASGLWPSVFNFGDVEALALGLPQPLLLKKVRHPDKVKDLLWACHRQSLRPAV